MNIRLSLSFVLIGLFASRAAGQAMIWSSGSPFPGELWGLFDLMHVGDTDGDGSSDLAVTSGAISIGSGRVAIVSGDDGGVRWSVIGAGVVNVLSVAALGDVDGDGLDDVVVGEPAFPLPPAPCAAQGRVRVLSGPDGSLIYSLVGFQCLSFFGSGVTALPDIDGDGTSELVVAARNEVSGAGPFGFGVLRALSGGLASPGSILWSAAYPTIYQTGYPPVPPLFPTVDDVTRIGDLTGDGVPDLVSSGPDSAERVISGATGALVFLFVPAFYGSGAIVNPPNQRYRWDFDGDVSGDGLADLLGASVTGTPWIGSFGPGSVVSRSGSSGIPLWFVEPPPPAYGFGWCVVGGEDWDGDGIPDCAVAAPGFGVGRIYVLDGAGGATRYVIDGPPSAGLVGFGTQVARIDDVTGDGVQEIAASAPLASVGGVGNTGRLYLFTLCDTFGAPCVSSGGLSPRLRCLGGAVSTGNGSFGLRLENAPPGAPTLLLLGSSNTTWGGLALPAPLPASPGCLVRVAGDVLVTPAPGVTSLAGVAQADLPIPSLPGLAGSTFYAQWILLDPGSGNFLSSPAVRLPVLP